MKVSELIELLQEMDPEAEVHFSYNYGDHWRTRVAPAVDEVFEGTVAYSQYHSMDKLIGEYDEDEDEGDDEKTRRVVVIG